MWIIKKYEKLLEKLNIQIQDWTFDIEKNKNYIEKIINIYNQSKTKNFEKVKILIEELEYLEKKIFENSKKLDYQPMPSPACAFVGNYSECEKSDENITRDWKDNISDEDNIESFNSIEMISAIFLKNLQNKLWTQK